MALDLATLVVAEHLISPTDLERVERGRASRGRPLWAALVESGLVSEEQIHHLLDESEGFPSVGAERLAVVAPPVRLLQAVSGPRAQATGILPLELSTDGSQAVVAMIDPSDRVALDGYCAAASLASARALLAPPHALRAALRRIYGATPSVEIDPELADEMRELPPGALHATPAPVTVRRRPPAPATPEPDTPRLDTEAANRAASRRLTRALIEVIEALVRELEARLGARPRAAELSRLARRVARQLGCAPDVIDEIGVVALLLGVHTALRLTDGRPRATGDGDAGADLVESLGWAAAGEGGIAHALRVLTAAASPFGRAGSGPSPLGARVVSACADYLELQDEAARQADAAPDRETVSQLLRAGTATAAVVDALLRVLEHQKE